MYFVSFSPYFILLSASYYNSYFLLCNTSTLHFTFHLIPDYTLNPVSVNLFSFSPYFKLLSTFLLLLLLPSV